MQTNTPSGVPTPQLVFETLNAYQRTEALRAAVELNLFTAIGEGHTDLAGLARHCGASERGTRILTDYLVVIGLLAKSDGHYANTATSAAFLDRRSPACVADIVRFLNHPGVMEPFRSLAEVVRTGRTALPAEGTVSDNNPLWVDFAHAMAPMMAPLAGPLGEIVLRHGAGPMRVLDIAAGHGLFGIEVARQNPHAQVTALDWSAVLEVAQANARQAHVDGRYATLPGDAFSVAFGGPYDLVLLTNFLHHFDPAKCVTLLEKVHAALGAGGRASALEFVPNEDRVSPPTAAAFGLVMLASTVAGEAYTYSELDAMFRRAGFARTTPHPLPMSPHTVVVAFKE